MLRCRTTPLARAALGRLSACAPLRRLPRPRLLTSTASPPAEPPLTLLQHLQQVGLWSFVALNVGAFFSAGDEGVQVLIHLDDFTGPVLSGDTSKRELTERLERISRGASQNDTLKLQLLSTPGMAERLLQLLTLESASPTARNHAAKVIEYIGSHPDGARQMVDKGMHETVLRLVRTEGASLYVRKALATLTCHLAAAPANVPILARAGAVSALHDEQESHPDPDAHPNAHPHASANAHPNPSAHPNANPEL